MRICILSREYPPDTGWGGIATFARHLAHGLKELGHDVEVVSMAKEGIPESSNLCEGIMVHRVGPYLKSGDLGLLGNAVPHSRFAINSIFSLWEKFLSLHRSQPFDVIDTPELLAEGLLPALARVAPLTIRLYTPHFKFVAEGLHNTRHTLDHQAVSMMERFALLNANAITSPSKDLADFVATDLNYPIDSMRIIMNPIDPDEFCPEGKMNLPADGKLKILYVGRLEERKGIHYLVRSIPAVLSRFPDATFYIIGDDTDTGKGHTSVKSELVKFISDTKCSANITFIPRVPLSELPDYYRSADICVVPSLYDNSPYSCLEAMSCGKAVIGTTSGGTKEYLVDGESGLLVPARDSAAIASAVIKLLESESERKRLGTNARLRVLQCFQRTEIARQTVEVYQEAIKNFEICKSLPQYRRAPEQLLLDADAFIEALHTTIHDILYAFSWRYRIASWLHNIRMRPKLFAGMVALKAFDKLKFMPFCRSGPLKDKINWLESEVREKSKRPVPKQGQLSTVAGKNN
jgi:glycosyltransferase involved in cell wall biosynthesis